MIDNASHQIAIMLFRKQEIERQNRLANNMVTDATWVSDAIELLLRLELERRAEHDL
jgi:hypothetical protein